MAVVVVSALAFAIGAWLFRSQYQPRRVRATRTPQVSA